jgi:hypothetical protein
MLEYNLLIGFTSMIHYLGVRPHLKFWILSTVMLTTKTTMPGGGLKVLMPVMHKEKA